MPFEKFDTSRINLLPLAQREHGLLVDDLLTIDGAAKFADPDVNYSDLSAVCEAVISARKKNAAVILMYGAHVIKLGLSPVLIQLMEEGYITHLATNGAGAIHDFELAMIGGTTEDVARYIQEGQFGLWQESGQLNDIVADGARNDLGFGEAVGRYIMESNFPYKDTSVLAAGCRCRIPVTVHVGVGNDIVHAHPNCNGAAIGEASMTDFLIYAKSVENLEGGVFLNFGSAVTGPEVYLKCLAMARNVAKQENRSIRDFTTAVFDLRTIIGHQNEPPKTDPAYYFRPWKTILARTVADGGKSYYIKGDHRATLGNMAKILI